MNINRHNYEEFFLLYVDNELQHDERLEVEDFVKQNPDLAAELTMLHDATLQQEEFSFDKKELLYKKEEGISLTNYEEYFVLSLDNELNKKEANEVEKFVLKHPELQDEFTLLKQTKLEPEVVEFSGKDTLYRTEKQRRIIPALWMKVSVAAAVLGLAVSTWILNRNSDTPGRPNNITASTKTTENKNIGTSVTQQPVIPLEDKTGTDEQKALAATVTTTSDKKKTMMRAGNKKDVLTIKKNALEVPEISTTAVTPNLASKSESRKEITESPGAIKTITNNGSKVNKDNTASAFVAAQKNVSEETHYATNTVYREIDTNEEDNSVYIGGTEINKNKLKGLFKKAAKFLGKKSSENDDEKTVRIAAFEFKSK